MNVFKDRKSGVYHVSFQTEHGARKISTGCTSKEDAGSFIKHSKIRELEIAARAARLTPQIVTQIMVGRNVTVQKALEDWTSWIATTGKAERTVQNQRLHLAQWIRNGQLESLSPNAITEKHISAWINSKGRNVKVVTRRLELIAIRSFFDCCLAKCYCAGNPSKLVRVNMKGLSHAQKETEARTAFTAEELRQLFNYMDDKLRQLSSRICELKEKRAKTNSRGFDRPIATLTHQCETLQFWRFASAIARWTGLRQGDIAQLEWDCFAQPERMNVWTDKRDRRVSLPLSQREFLKDMHANKLELPAATKTNALGYYQKMEKEFLPLIGAIPANPGKYCFPDQSKAASDIARRPLLSVQFGRIVERALLSHHSFHDLRHTYCTEMSRLSLPIEHISRSVGHVSVLTTKGYIHTA